MLVIVIVLAGHWVHAGSGGYVNLCIAQLGAIQEQGSLSCAVLLEDNLCVFRARLILDCDVLDLSAVEKSEVRIRLQRGVMMSGTVMDVTYQKLKKSLTSFSLVLLEIPATLTVLEDIMISRSQSVFVLLLRSL